MLLRVLVLSELVMLLASPASSAQPDGFQAGFAETDATPKSASLLTERRLAAQEDVADVVSQDLRAGKDEHKRYFLIQPPKGVKEPKKGYGLLVVLPGGDGSAVFHPFVKRIYKNAVPEGYVLAQPVAVPWTAKQEIVWPTDKNRVAGMKFSTEEFVDAVIKDVAGKYNLDPERVFTLTWSSSGPAAYAASLSSKQITGSFIAMSVFKPDLLPPLEKAKGQAYFLYHSPEDRTCPFRMAEQAAKQLKQSGATVKLATYEGGHGWRGALYDNIREGVDWLEKNHVTRAKP
jgi:predicted esterase